MRCVGEHGEVYNSLAASPCCGSPSRCCPTSITGPHRQPRYGVGLPAQALLTGDFSRGDPELHSRLVAAYRSNVYWQQYSQCHWAVARACGNVTCAEKEGHG